MTGWWVVIGTLGGVVITAVFSLVTTYLNHRWAVELFDAQQRADTGTVLRTLRREVYLRYLVAVQSFYDKTDKLYSDNSKNPFEPGEFVDKLPEELQSIRAAYEAARVDALLVADDGVHKAIDAYDEAFGKLWLRAASGTDWSPQQSTPHYDRLVATMHDEVVDLSGGGSGPRSNQP